MSNHDFRPTASIANLRNRAKLIGVIRQYFDDAGYFEVETPLLSSDSVVDAWLEPFVANWVACPTAWQSGGEPRYLQTSPEFGMKRLLAAGADSIYQLGKVFRNGEFGSRHNPEFTMLEWYRCNDNIAAMMDFTETLVKRVISVGAGLVESECSGEPSDDSLSSPLSEGIGGDDPVDRDRTSGPQSPHQRLLERALHESGFERLTYEAAFKRHVDVSVLNCHQSELHVAAHRHDLIPPPGLDDGDRDGWLNFLLAELVEPQLGRERPTFLTNYPASQAALARLASDGITAERFELYIDGIELCNGYDELTDSTALQQRISEQATLRFAAGARPLPAESRLLTAMNHGLPASAGNALGVDRLIMLALRQRSLSDVIAFPFDVA